MNLAVKDGHFISMNEKDGTAEKSSSLINYIPLMLGKQLPQTILQQLIKDLQPGGDFLTEYGMASESIKSDKYEYDGYWRGPIWAPPTYQIFCGLLDAGEKDLAKIIAQRYCNNQCLEPAKIICLSFEDQQWLYQQYPNFKTIRTISCRRNFKDSTGPF